MNSNAFFGRLVSVVVVAGSMVVTAGAMADTLYVGTAMPTDVAGQLYAVDPANAASSLIGSFLDGAGNPYGITGLAVDQTTGVLYGSSSRQNASGGQLVTINPATALVTPIGSFGIGSTMADITIDPVSGVMYGWESGGGHQLHTINTTTGLATVVGASSIPDFGGGGLAMDSGQVLYSTPDGSSGSPPTLRTVDTGSGITAIVAALSAGPVNLSVNAMDFNSAWALFGVNGGGSTGGNTRHLVTINTSSGVLTDIGSLPDRSDALAFVRNSVPESGTWGAAFACVIGSLTLWWRRRRD
jgi:hypothetical protein